MIAFLADSSTKIGMGHMMRCLSIADRLKELGAEISFICATDGSPALSAGFGVIKRSGGTETVDSGEILEIIKNNGIERLITDSYIPGEEYFSKIDKALRSIRIFDIGNPDYICNTVIDYNFDSGNYNFKNAKNKLIGLKYAPLRREFENLPKKYISEEIKKVIITAGGSDPVNAGCRILTEVLNNREFNNMEFTVVSGPLNPYIDELIKISECFGERVKVIRAADNMAELLTEADAALTAGGSTLSEICACGVPAVAFSIADNQEPMIKEASSAGLALSGGSLERKDSDIGKISEGLLKLKADKNLREKMSGAMQSAADGLGARRIARHIINYNE